MQAISLIHGDSLKHLKDIKNESVDLILTDPPFLTTNLRFDKGFDLKPFIPELNRVLKPNGWFFCFGTIEMVIEIMSQGWRRKFEYIWVKQQPLLAHHNVQRPNIQHELIFSFIKPTLQKMGDLYLDKESIRTTGKPYMIKKERKAMTEFRAAQGMNTHKIKEKYNTGYRNGTTVLYFNSKLGMPLAERTKHPTQKPLDLIRLIVRGYCPKNGMVLDPFAGSGTTVLAAKMEGRNSIGIEIDKNYFDIMEKRVGTYNNIISYSFQGNEK